MVVLFWRCRQNFFVEVMMEEIFSFLTFLEFLWLVYLGIEREGIFWIYIGGRILDTVLSFLGTFWAGFWLFWIVVEPIFFQWRFHIRLRHRFLVWFFLGDLGFFEVFGGGVVLFPSTYSIYKKTSSCCCVFFHWIK